MARLARTIKTRTLMAYVAAAALLVAGLVRLEKLYERGLYYQYVAQYYGAHSFGNSPRAVYHIQLKRKYDYAASHPWLPVPADPLPPPPPPPD
jgi:hypothetical protein